MKIMDIGLSISVYLCMGWRLANNRANHLDFDFKNFGMREALVLFYLETVEVQRSLLRISLPFLQHLCKRLTVQTLVSKG